MGQGQTLNAGDVISVLGPNFLQPILRCKFLAHTTSQGLPDSCL